MITFFLIVFIPVILALCGFVFGVEQRGLSFRPKKSLPEGKKISGQDQLLNTLEERYVLGTMDYFEYCMAVDKVFDEDLQNWKELYPPKDVTFSPQIEAINNEVYAHTSGAGFTNSYAHSMGNLASLSSPADKVTFEVDNYPFKIHENSLAREWLVIEYNGVMTKMLRSTFVKLAENREGLMHYLDQESRRHKASMDTGLLEAVSSGMITHDEARQIILHPTLHH